MAFTFKDLTQDTGKVAAEDFARWLASWLRGTQNGQAISGWITQNIGQISSGLRRVLSILFRIGIDPPEWLVKRIARAFKMDPEIAMRILEEGLDQFIDTLCEVFGVADLRSPEEAKKAIKEVSQEALNRMFAIRKRADGKFEAHEIRCRELLCEPLVEKKDRKIGFDEDEVQKAEDGKSKVVAPGPVYQAGVKEKPLSWVLDNIDVVAIPWCCERELPREVRTQVLGIHVPATTAKGTAKSEPKPEKPELHPLAIVLNMMRLPPDGPAAANARFYENLMGQAEAIPELEGICTSIRECATKPVWDVASFMSVLTRAIGEGGQVATTPPPAGVDIEDHRRAQVSERAKHFAIAMELHVLACESKTIGAIMGRVFADFKGMSATAFHFLALDTDKSPTAKEIVTSIKESTDKMHREADEMLMARLRKRANHFR